MGTHQYFPILAQSSADDVLEVAAFSGVVLVSSVLLLPGPGDDLGSLEAGGRTPP